MNNYHSVLINSKIPKYKQVAKILISDIESGIYQQDEQLPSINETSVELLISRDTVEKAYKLLKEQGIIQSIPGKGYFVSKSKHTDKLKICLLFNKLSNYKKETYDGFMNIMQDKASIDLFVYNYNIKVFERLIEENKSRYDYFVIVPHFHRGSRGAGQIVKQLPKEKVILIDKKINVLFDEYPTVYQDFEQDIQDALLKGIQQIKKYKRLILAYPYYRHFSKEIHLGFAEFCRRNSIVHKVIDKIEDEDLRYKDAYVVISDDDLVTFLKKAKEKGFKPGKDVGVVSYNENPVKEILEGGVTTISTNHGEIGRLAALMILHKRQEKIKIPFAFIKRKTL